MRPTPLTKIPAWPEEIAADRLHQCKAILYIHGFITEAENRRIQERMLKWVEKHVSAAQSGDERA